MKTKNKKFSMKSKAFPRWDGQSYMAKLTTDEGIEIQLIKQGVSATDVLNRLVGTGEVFAYGRVVSITAEPPVPPMPPMTK